MKEFTKKIGVMLLAVVLLVGTLYSPIFAVTTNEAKLFNGFYVTSGEVPKVVTQGSQPWCMAYVTASIMRYKTGHTLSTISARKVMEWAYPNLTTSQLESTALSTTKAAEYANTYNVKPVYTSSSDDRIKNGEVKHNESLSLI